jgi:rhodanese-related sulfurtransferase
MSRLHSSHWLVFVIWLGVAGRGFADDGPVLSFVPQKLAGGLFFVDDRKEYRVALRNSSMGDAVIKAVETDCECMVVTGKPTVVKAKEGADLRLTYQSHREVDALVKVTVQYSVGKEERQAELEFAAEVLERKVVPSACKVTAGEIVGKTDCVVVDVRPENRFQEVRIPGSLNLPLFAVKTKSILREARLVIVGEGYADGPLYAEALAMVKAGFRNVRVISGGIRAWENAGGKLERVRHLNLGLVPPSLVPSIERDPDWKIIQIADGAVSDPLPQSDFLPARVDCVAGAGELAEKIKALGGKVLLVTASNQAARSVLESLPPRPGAAVFSVEGGMPAAVRAQHASAFPAGTATVRVQGIKQVGAPGRGAAKKGCGSCQ